MKGLRAQGLRERVAGLNDLLSSFLFRSDGKDDDLMRAHARWQDDSVVIAMRHDERADESSAHAPARGMRILAGIITAGELDACGFGEVLSEVVASAGMDSLSILYHSLDCVGVYRSREALVLRLHSWYDGDG